MKTQVYKITFADGSYYFGCSRNPKARVYEHRYNNTNGRIANRRLATKFDAQLDLELEIIETFSSIEEAREFELTLLKETLNEKEDPLCLNRGVIPYTSDSKVRTEISKLVKAWWKRDPEHLVGLPPKPITATIGDTQINYPSIRHASRAMSCVPATIREHLKNKKPFKGYVFSYAEPLTFQEA